MSVPLFLSLSLVSSLSQHQETLTDGWGSPFLRRSRGDGMTGGGGVRDIPKGRLDSLTRGYLHRSEDDPGEGLGRISAVECRRSCRSRTDRLVLEDPSVTKQREVLRFGWGRVGGPSERASSRSPDYTRNSRRTRVTRSCPMVRMGGSLGFPQVLPDRPVRLPVTRPRGPGTRVNDDS